MFPTWKCSKQGMWIISTNQVIFSGKRHFCWVSNVLLGSPSSSIILERRQIFLCPNHSNNTQQLTLKQSVMRYSTTGKKEKYTHFNPGRTVPSTLVFPFYSLHHVQRKRQSASSIDCREVRRELLQSPCYCQHCFRCLAYICQRGEGGERGTDVS